MSNIMKMDINQWGKLARIERKFTRHNLTVMKKILVRLKDEFPQLEDAITSYIRFQMKNEEILMEKAKNLNLVVNHLFEQIISGERELHHGLKEKDKTSKLFKREMHELHLFEETEPEKAYNQAIGQYLDIYEKSKKNYAEKLKDFEEIHEKIKLDKFEKLTNLFVELIDEESNYYRESIEDLNLIHNIHYIDDSRVIIPQISVEETPSQLKAEGVDYIADSTGTISVMPSEISSSAVQQQSRSTQNNHVGQHTIFKKSGVQSTSIEMLDNVLEQIKHVQTHSDVAKLIRKTHFDITNRVAGSKINLDMLFFARKYQGDAELVNKNFLNEVEQKMDFWKSNI